MQSLCFLNSKKQCPPQVPPAAPCPYLRPEISVTRLKQTHPCPQNGAFQKDSDFFKGISLSTSILAVFIAIRALISSRVFYNLEGEKHGEQQHRLTDARSSTTASQKHRASARGTLVSHENPKLHTNVPLNGELKVTLIRAEGLEWKHKTRGLKIGLQFS